MILDLPMKDFQRLAPGSGKTFKEVRKYFCDDLSISNLMVVRKGEGEPSGLQLEIRGSVFVRPSYDRKATLRFDAVKGDERLATTQIADLRAPEEKTRTFKTTLIIDAADAARLFAAGQPPLLRITVTVQDDK
jgi:hypothetical protein